MSFSACRSVFIKHKRRRILSRQWRDLSFKEKREPIFLPRKKAKEKRAQTAEKKIAERGAKGSAEISVITAEKS